MAWKRYELAGVAIAGLLMVATGFYSVYNKHILPQRLSKDQIVYQDLGEYQEDVVAYSHHQQLLPKSIEVEGEYITIPQANYFTKFIQERPDIKRVVEIGFNAGHSAAVFLGARPDIWLTAFDVGKYTYTTSARGVLRQQFPDRFDLIIGDSTEIVPRYTSLYMRGYFDLAYVDGNHYGKVPYKDIINAAKLVRKGGWIFVDGVCLQFPDVLRAWYKAVDKGLVKQSSLIKLGNRTWAIGQVT